MLLLCDCSDIKLSKLEQFNEKIKMIRLLLLIIALISGMASIWMFVNRPMPEMVEESPVINAESSVEPPEVVEEAPVIQVEVLVAARDISPGRFLNASDFRWQAIDQNAAIEGALIRSENPDVPDALLGKVVKEAVSEGDAIDLTLVEEVERRNLSMLLEPGERAISINVSEDVMAGGFILPGDHVDLIHVRPLNEGNVESRVLATNVEVVALDQSMSESINSTNYISRTATLIVKFSDLTRISAAIEAPGRLSLALRSNLETSEDMPEVDVAPEDEVNQEEGLNEVRVIRNGNIETIMVRP